jgi:hypothetical protein
MPKWHTMLRQANLQRPVKGTGGIADQVREAVVGNGFTPVADDGLRVIAHELAL